MVDHHRLLFLLTFLLTVSKCQSWGWFFSSKEAHSTSNENFLSGSVAEFSIDGFNDQKGIRLMENAKNNLKLSLNSCWQSAHQHLFSGCSEGLAVDEKRSRFAWHLSDCFQKDSGRPPFPSCDPKSSMAKCLKVLNEYEHKVYLEFYLETNSICHQLQAHAFRHETERLVNELKSSANYAEEKLEIIEERTENLLQGSNQIFDSLNSIDLRTQQVAQTTKNDSYSHLGQEIDNLRNEAAEIEKEISRVGDEMSMKMKFLQSKADDIGDIAGISLDKQQQPLDGQTTALNDLQF
ncbi:gamete expressed protein [Trema orientale]|uniref:Gamete expressed protein n=1 Tax=Trema orientale TaxID=63057 RepID=A0A2P5DEM0_TREOI|nr:gamete expressed protein [Trema orientale]